MSKILTDEEMFALENNGSKGAAVLSDEDMFKLEQQKSIGDSVGAGFLARALSLSNAMGGASSEAVKSSLEDKEINARQNPLATGIGGMAVDTLAAAPGIAAVAASGLTALPAMGLSTLVSGVPAGVGQGTERYNELINSGVDENEARNAALIRGGTGALGMGMPASLGGNLLSRFAVGGTMNTAMDEIDRQLENTVLPENKTTPFSFGNAALQFGMGGVMGALGPKSNPFKETADTPSIKPSTTEETPSVSGIDVKERAIKQRELLRNKLDEEAQTRLLKAVEGNASPEEMLMIKHLDEQVKKLDEEINQLRGNKPKETILEEVPSVKEKDTIPSRSTDVDVSGVHNPYFTKGIDPTKVDVESESLTGSSFRPDVSVEKDIPSSKKDGSFTSGQNRGGILVVDPTRIIEVWNGLSPENKEMLKSPRGLQLFTEMHEALHNFIKDERTLNRVLLKEIAPILEKRRIPRNYLNNIERIISEKYKLPVRDGILPEVKAKYEPKEEVSSEKLQYSTEHPSEQEFPPVEVYEHDNMPDMFKDKSPQQIRYEMEKNQQKLDSVVEQISRYEDGSLPSGSVDPGKLYSRRDLLESLIDDQERALMEARNQGQNTQYKQKKSSMDMSLEGMEAKRGVTGLQEVAEGKKPPILGDKDTITTPEQAIAEMTSRPDIGVVAGKTLSNIFGRDGFTRIFTDNPVLKFANHVITKANEASNQLRNRLWYGSFTDVKGDFNKKSWGFIMPLKRLMAMDSPAAVLSKLEDKSLLKVMSAFEDGFHKNQTYETTFKEYESRFSAEEKAAWNTLVKLYEGMSVGIHETRAGWFPAQRHGNYMVKLFSNDIAVHAETFRSELEAQHFIKKWESLPNKGDVTASSVLNLAEQKQNSKLDFDFAMRLTSIIANEIAPMKQQEITKLVNTMLGKTDPFMQHNKQRSGISGYEGSRLFKSEKQQANDWREALHSAVDEHANSLFRGIVNKELTQVIDAPNGLRDTHPNTIEAAELLRDVAMNNVRTLTEGMDNSIRNGADKLAVKIAEAFGNKDWFPKNSVFDRVHGVSTRLFYISALTTRPGFWLAQALSSPLAIRQMLREESLFKSLASAGKGTMNIFYGGDKAFKDAVFWTAQNTDSFHPSFISELNSLTKSDMKNFHNNVFELFSGEKFSTAADSFSRYWTFSMMYEHYKEQGLRGTPLYKKAAEATNSTMIMYSGKDKAPMLKKAGIVGQSVSPLMTFSQANLANFIADIKLAKQTKNYYPAAMTMVMTSLLGGVMGAPLIAEYELLRKILISMNDDLKDIIPSPVDWALKETPPEVTHGVISGATGFDIGSGLRWNPIVSGVITGNSNFLSIAPALNFAKDLTVSGATTVKKALGGNVTDAEYRKAQMKLTPGGYKGIVDDLLFNAKERAYVPDNQRGAALVEQTDKERASTYLGSSTIEKGKSQVVYNRLKEDELRLAKSRQKRLDLIVDGIEKGEDVSKHAEWLIESGVKPTEIKQQIITALLNRNTPLLERFYGGAKGIPKSSEQMRKFGKVMEYDNGQ